MVDYVESPFGRLTSVAWPAASAVIVAGLTKCYCTTADPVSTAVVVVQNSLGISDPRGVITAPTGTVDWSDLTQDTATQWSKENDDAIWAIESLAISNPPASTRYTYTYQTKSGPHPISWPSFLFGQFEQVIVSVDPTTPADNTFRIDATNGGDSAFVSTVGLSTAQATADELVALATAGADPFPDFSWSAPTTETAPFEAVVRAEALVAVGTSPLTASVSGSGSGTILNNPSPASSLFYDARRNGTLTLTNPP